MVEWWVVSGRGAITISAVFADAGFDFGSTLFYSILFLRRFSVNF